MHLDFQSELAPDLEWMLQSGQVPKDVLLQALLQEHYAPVYRLALSLLDDESCARRAARITFTNALFELHAYRGPNGVRPWLYSILGRACRTEGQKLERRRALLASLPFNKHTHVFGDSLPETEFDAALWLAVDELAEAPRLLLLLSDLHGWSLEAVAALQQTSLEDAQEGLRQARLDVLTAAWAAPGQKPSSEKAKDDQATGGIIQSSLQRRWSWREIPPEEIDHVFHQINRQLGGATWRRKGIMHLREWSFVLLAGLAALAILWGASLVEPALQENSETAVPTWGGIQATQTPEADAQAAQATYIVVTPTLPATFEPLPTSAFYTITDQDLLASTQEQALESIAQKLGTTAAALAEFNRLTLASALQAGQLLAIPGQIPESEPPPATPVAPRTRLQHLPPFTDSEHVFKRMYLDLDLYNTLWLDAYSIDYGPSNYYGPPRITRLQTWLGENQTLVLLGSSQAALPSLAMLLLSYGDSLYLAHPSAGRPWYDLVDSQSLVADPQVAQVDLILRTILDSNQMDPATRMEVMGEETVAGQTTLQIDLLDFQGVMKERFWLDDSANLVLREQIYDGDNEILREIIVDQINYDIDFPQHLFDPHLPWRGGFAADYSGVPITGTETLVITGSSRQYDPFASDQATAPAPDIVNSPLSFVYPQDFDPGLDVTATTSVYAGEALAGELDFGNPWTMRCERSPNGRYLAYVPHPGSENGQDGSLRVVDLLDPQLQETFYLDDYLVTEFAMSPNSFFLAFFARSRNENEPGVVGIMDLGNGVMKPLFPTGSARSIAWSPPGTQVAAIVKYSAEALIEQVYVVDVTSADGVYERVYSEWLDEPPGSLEDAPFWRWGVPFPASTGGFSECANAPAIEE